MRPLHDHVIVDPLYDAQFVGSGHAPDPTLPPPPLLELPRSMENPMAQQGIVTAVSDKETDIQVGDHILFHPFVAIPIKVKGIEFLAVARWHIAGWLTPDGKLFPLPDDVVIMPMFKPRGEHKVGSIIAVTMDPDPPTVGIVLRVGDRVREFATGDMVVIPYDPHGANPIGSEIGLVNKVYYTIPEREIPAKVGLDG